MECVFPATAGQWEQVYRCVEDVTPIIEESTFTNVLNVWMEHVKYTRATLAYCCHAQEQGQVLSRECVLTVRAMLSCIRFNVFVFQMFKPVDKPTQLAKKLPAAAVALNWGPSSSHGQLQKAQRALDWLYAKLLSGVVEDCQRECAQCMATQGGTKYGVYMHSMFGCSLTNAPTCTVTPLCLGNPSFSNFIWRGIPCIMEGLHQAVIPHLDMCIFARNSGHVLADHSVLMQQHMLLTVECLYTCMQDMQGMLSKYALMAERLLVPVIERNKVEGKTKMTSNERLAQKIVSGVSVMMCAAADVLQCNSVLHGHAITFVQKWNACMRCV